MDSTLRRTEGEEVIVVQDEDASGWSMITTKDGRRGLVPASYLQIDDGESEEGGNKQGTLRSFSTSAGLFTHLLSFHPVVALYDYIAAGADELSCTEGDRISLTSLGFGFGEGWVEVIIDGQIGILPSSYVSMKIPCLCPHCTWLT